MSSAESRLNKGERFPTRSEKRASPMVVNNGISVSLKQGPRR